MSSEKLKLENQICHSLYSATNALVRLYRPLLEALDLTYPQYLVMMALWERDEVVIKDLVERTRLDAGTLTPILNRLKTKGFLNLVKSTEDSRQKRVILTVDGHKLADEAEKVPEALSCKIGWERDDARDLKRLTEKLYGQLVQIVP